MRKLIIIVLLFLNLTLSGCSNLPQANFTKTEEALSNTMVAIQKTQVALNTVSAKEIEPKQTPTSGKKEPTSYNKKTEIPVGIYKIGKKIEPGYWTVSLKPKSNMSIVRIGTSLKEGNNDIDQFSTGYKSVVLTKDNPEITLYLTEGYWLQVRFDSAVFSPSTGYY